MQIQSIKYADVAQTSLQVTLDDNSVMSVPWPCQTWHNQLILDWIALGNTIADAYTAQELEEQALANMIQDLKVEGLNRIQAVMPAISNFDTLELVREMWLSIAPAARSATADFQTIIDIYQAARDGIIYLKGATAGQVAAYDVTTDPSWPV